jgi:hypothetical protein
MCGYDMTWRRVDDSEKAAVTAARLAQKAAWADRDALPEGEGGTFNVAKAKLLNDWDSHEVFDGRTARFISAQDRVMAASDAVYDAQRSYFRLNIFGMSRYTDAMERVGMVFDDLPYPDFPKLGDYDLTDEQWEAFEYPDDDAKPVEGEALAAAEKFKAAQDEVLSWHGMADTPGIPAHKFSTNDGWIVLPVECQAAVKAWRAYVAEQGDEAKACASLGLADRSNYWLKWIAYLEGAARHDGFEVD